MTLNVVCVLKTELTNFKRPVYDQSWVDKLYRAVKRNYTKSFNFVCLTNDIKHHTDYNVYPLSFDVWGWWNKLDIFAPNLFFGPTLYLDLDVVVCKDFTQAFESLPADVLLMCTEPFKNLFNSSVMYWNGDLSDIYFDFVKDQEYFVKKYELPTKQQQAIGDGAFIADKLCSRIQSFDKYLSKGFFNWKHHKIETIIDDPTMLIFTSTEKPSNNIDLPIVKKHWI